MCLKCNYLSLISHMFAASTFFFFFFNDTATTEIYTLSLHDALPISSKTTVAQFAGRNESLTVRFPHRSEEHTSELQSRLHLVCRLLLEKKKKILSNQTQNITCVYAYSNLQ